MDLVAGSYGKERKRVKPRQWLGGIVSDWIRPDTRVGVARQDTDDPRYCNLGRETKGPYVRGFRQGRLAHGVGMDTGGGR